jgi:acyl carrier protein
VVDNFLFGEAGDLQDDTSFMESGLLDSTGVLDLVAFLEGAYAFKIQPVEMLPENLDSVNRVSAFVARKLEQRNATKA